MKKGVGGLSGAAAAVAVLLWATTPANAATGGNDFYRVTLENLPAGVGIGVYTVTTGPMHPVTGALGMQNVLFGGGIPGTSFTTIRSYSSGTDYVQRAGLTLAAGAPPTLPLEGFVMAGEEAIPVGDPMSPSGFRTVYRPGTAAAAPDMLTIQQEASVVGTNFNNSAAKIRTSITNEGTSAVTVGVRYLWDFQIGPGDDGPSFQAKSPDGAVLAAEADHLAPAFDRFECLDNNDPGACFGVGNTPFPFFAVSGSVTGPAALAPTPPSRIAFVSWPNVSGLAGKILPLIPAFNAFDYAPSAIDAASCIISVDDSGAAYWWGDQASNALTIAPGATVSVAAYIFAHLPGQAPIFQQPGVEGPPGDPTCADGEDNDGDGLVDGDDPDCVPPPEEEGPPGDPTCEDGQDNDGDGLVDGDDPDCVPSVNQPPDCAAAASDPNLIWPPNHKFRPVAIEGVTDPDGDPVTVTVTAVAQDEPLNSLGDGNTCPDATGVGTGAASIRAERSGQGDGRVYHVEFTADDGQGGQCTGEVTICVPHDKSRKKNQCVDQGPLHDSVTGACPPKPGKGPKGK